LCADGIELFAISSSRQSKTRNVSLGEATVISINKDEKMNSSTICKIPVTRFVSSKILHKKEALRTRPPRGSLKVLVVDDDKRRAAANGEIISGFGHSVKLARDGITALRMAAANRPDAVLLNTDLRGPDQCDVARHLRSDYPAQPPLIIGFASHINRLTRWQCVNAGMDLVFEAPLDAEAIETLLLFECAKLAAERNSDSSTHSQRRRVCKPAKPIAVVASHSIAANQLLLNLIHN
jgi:CheY-like chemotaxis protein